MRAVRAAGRPSVSRAGPADEEGSETDMNAGMASGIFDARSNP